MRTTVSIQDSLLQRAKEASLQRGCSLSEVVGDALRMALTSQPKSRRTDPTRRLKTFRGSGLQPGVDLTSSGGLIELMEGR
jgi:hypothetical protein